MNPPPIATNRKSKENILSKFYKKYCNKRCIYLLLFDVDYFKYTSILILIAELILSIIVIQNVSYTETDWITYIQVSEGFLNGGTNFAELEGNRLVFRTDFIQFYSILDFITSHGRNIRLAQYFFMGIYLLQMALVLRLYKMSQKVPPIVLIITTFSFYRIHSIYLLKLFNDPVAILCLCAAINLYMERKWTLGTTFFSLAVSIKMNVLFFAPAVLVIFLTYLGILQTINQLMVYAAVQLSLISFDLGFAKAFDHKWSVNYTYMKMEILKTKIYQNSLLTYHLLLLALVLPPLIWFLKNYLDFKMFEDLDEPRIDRENRKSVTEVEQVENEEVSVKHEKTISKDFEGTLKSSIEKPLTILTENESNPESEHEDAILELYIETYVQMILLPLFFITYIAAIIYRSFYHIVYIWYFHSFIIIAIVCAFLGTDKMFAIGFN